MIRVGWCFERRRLEIRDWKLEELKIFNLQFPYLFYLFTMLRFMQGHAPGLGEDSVLAAIDDGRT